MISDPDFFVDEFAQAGTDSSLVPKIGRVRQMIDRIKPGCELEVDGGVDATTAPLAVAAGADVLVAGSAIFNDGKGVTAAMERLRAAARL